MVTTCTQHSWSAPDGQTFPYSLWESEQPLRAIMIAVHGLSGAALDYEPLGRHLAREGFSTYALELRGQGNDPVPERRGDLVLIEDWYGDLRAFFALVRRMHPGLPAFYYGESMGAALLTRFLAQAEKSEQPAGLILASPVVVVPADTGWWKRFVFHSLLFLTPKRRIDVSKFTKREDENDPAKWVTRDEAHRRWFSTASHKITSYTFRFFKCIFELIGGCLDAAPHLHVPVLVIYAAHDVFISTQKVERFFALLGSKDKELELFPESYHLLLHDYDRAKALERIVRWLRSRVN